MSNLTKKIFKADNGDSFTFAKVERDCDYNRNCRKVGFQSEPNWRTGKSTKLSLIYDFEVYVNGQLRAILRPSYNKGYYIARPDGQHIRKQLSEYTSVEINCESQGTFVPFIQDLLRRGVIPTQREYKDQLRKEAREKQRKEQAEKLQAKHHRINRAAPKLLRLLKSITAKFPAFSNREFQQAEALIKSLEK